MHAIVTRSSRTELLAGAACGLASGLALLLARLQPGGEDAMLVQLDSAGAEIALHLVFATLLGAALAVLVPEGGRAPAAAVAVGLATGLGFWTFGSLTLSPLLAGDTPTWSVDAAGAAMPSLVGDLFYGALAALLLALTARFVPARAPAEAGGGTRILILGGGFGGVAAARRLEGRFARDPSVEVTVVSESNYLLFTPLLAEVAGGALEPQHVSAPVRAACGRARVRRATVEAIDLEARSVSIRSGPGAAAEALRYDHLVLALGSVPTYRDLPGLEEHAFALKSLGDASTLRNHVLGLLELADAEADPVERRRMLTFVVVGGGFAGTETAAELFDLVHAVRHYYPHVPAEELRFVLVHSGDRILPELSPELGAYALAKLEQRGLELLLETRVAGATAESILLEGAEPIRTRTVVWTAGNRPSPLVADLGLETSRAGAILADATLRVPGGDGVWAIGDCAQIPDPDHPGTAYPPTAQHALRQGKAVADNIAAVLAGHEPKPFRFRTIGLLVGLGRRTAAAEIKGRCFSGLGAWLLWRGIYWTKLPGVEKKLRVLFDWTIDLAFPRDIVQTEPPPPRAPEPRTDEGARA
jgi:NADH dehydrogenase